MVRLTSTNLPSPAAPYLLEIRDIGGQISWDRHTDAQPGHVQITLEGLPRKDVRELADAFGKLGPYRKVLVRLFTLESPNRAVMFSGFIKEIASGGGAGPVTLEIEEV
jgi:hypothetical protein